MIGRGGHRCRLCLLRALLLSLKAWSSRMGMCWLTSRRWSGRLAAYLKYERWVHPVRFLNLLPLSHVFGQFLGMFLPPLLGGTVIFQEELRPSEIVSTIRRERVSVLVSVPRVLQSLKQKIERDLEDEGKLKTFGGGFGRRRVNTFCAAGGFFARFAGSLGGSSGHLFAVARRWMRRRNNSGIGLGMPRSRDTG